MVSSSPRLRNDRYRADPAQVWRGMQFNDCDRECRFTGLPRFMVLAPIIGAMSEWVGILAPEYKLSTLIFKFLVKFISTNPPSPS